MSEDIKYFIAFNEGCRPEKLKFKSTKTKIYELLLFNHFHEIKNRDSRFLLIEYQNGKTQTFRLADIPTKNHKLTLRVPVISFWISKQPSIKKKVSKYEYQNKTPFSGLNKPKTSSKGVEVRGVYDG